MALPWLIGGLVVLAGRQIVKKLNESDDNGDRDDEREHRRRREEAERERSESERKKKLDAARENFAMHGEGIGLDIALSLQGWIEVQFERSPAFSARLNSKNGKTYTIANEQDMRTLLPSENHQFDRIRENLKIYSNTYSVRLKKGVKLVEVEKEREVLESELKQIGRLKAEISRLHSAISSQL